MEEEKLSPEETMALQQIINENYPKEEEKHNVFKFFDKVLTDIDNTKSANLDKDELGLPKLPVRSNQEISLLCKTVGNKFFEDYFNSEAQIILGTSLSKEGFLDRLVVTQKRELEQKKRFSPSQKKNWFRKGETGGSD